MSADYVVHGSVAVITLNNPPVNGLGMATRTAAVEALRRAESDEAVKAVVITGAGKVFSGGADIREFNSPKALTEPTLHTLIATAENLKTGGRRHPRRLHGRRPRALARLPLPRRQPGAQIGLPEVKIGLVPGAGGTQRLPRVVGLEQGLNMIVSGNPVLSEKLAETKLFDKVLPSRAPTWSPPPSNSPTASPTPVRCRKCAT
jgi:3-hydroxyacyl-CoA dehydrogenase